MLYCTIIIPALQHAYKSPCALRLPTLRLSTMDPSLHTLTRPSIILPPRLHNAPLSKKTLNSLLLIITYICYLPKLPKPTPPLVRCTWAEALSKHHSILPVISVDQGRKFLQSADCLLAITTIEQLSVRTFGTSEPVAVATN